MRERMDSITVDAFHRFRRDERIDDGFFGRLNGRIEQWVHFVIRIHRHLLDADLVRLAELRRRERDENIAR